MQPEESAFIMAICLDPDNDAPRLVYADWLEETGEPLLIARAEFIRVQCELAKLDEKHPGRPKLKRREEELLGKNLNSWMEREMPKELLPSWQISRWKGVSPGYPLLMELGPFERGFLAELTMREFQQDLVLPGEVQAALEMTPLRKLSLVTSGGTGLPAGIAEVETTASLRELIIDGEVDWEYELVNDVEETAPLWSSPAFATLTSLSLLYYAEPTVLGIASASNLASLQRLSLCENDLTPEGLAEVFRFPHLSNLRVLDLQRNFLWCEEGFRLLLEHPGLDNLERIDLRSDETPVEFPEPEQNTIAKLRDRFGERMLFE